MHYIIIEGKRDEEIKGEKNLRVFNPVWARVKGEFVIWMCLDLFVFQMLIKREQIISIKESMKSNEKAVRRKESI